MRNLLLIALIAFGAASASAQAGGPVSKSLRLFLDKADAAQRELQDGRPAAYKELWSRSGDVTLSGGFGGVIEKGWANVSKRLDWAGAQFTNGENKIERVATGESGHLAYLVQYEHIRYRAPGETAELSKDYRVTMIFRREKRGWRIVHRHADSQVLRQSPKP